jgi:hypothetical protein
MALIEILMKRKAPMTKEFEELVAVITEIYTKT